MRTKKSKQKVVFMSFLILSLFLFGDVNGNSNGVESSIDVIPSTDCEADFSYTDYTGPFPVLGGIKFTNLSTGPYTDLSWDFGDGDYSTGIGASITHFYTQSGSYEVKLSVWNSDTQACLSTSSTIVEVWISEDPCDQLDCVWPGDTNADGLANLEDILNIGLNFGATGPPRDEVCGGWYGHPAMDWNEYTYDGVNLKHSDCNGDGIITLSDLPYTANMAESYTKLENGVSFAESDGPPVKLQFNVDTVHVTDATATTEIFASLMLGSPDVPMEDVYGIVLYLNFPGIYVDSSSQVSVEYFEDSFFGESGEVIPRAIDLSDQSQVDFGLTRKDGENISGDGRVATFSFIIDADIIDGREEAEGQSFNVSVHVVKVIDKFGNELDISLSAEPASVFFVNNIITKVVDPVLSEKVKVFPNPVSDELTIDLGDLNGQIMELYDMLGKRVIYRELESDSILSLNVNKFEKGMYILKIQTEQGIVSKRVVVK